jgi:hypothetical protein
MARTAFALLAALCAALLLAGPASARRSSQDPPVLVYEVRSASGYESVTFHGDGTDSCRKAGLCDTSGHARYEFHSRGKGLAALIGLGTPFASGFGDFNLSGTTTSSVTQAGAASTCTDSVKHDSDSFTMEPKGRRIMFAFHLDPYQSDYLRTHCAGPGEEDLALARMLPQALVSPRQLVKRNVTVTFKRSGPFHVGAFSGTVDTKIVVALRQAPNAIDDPFDLLGL